MSSSNNQRKQKKVNVMNLPSDMTSDEQNNVPDKNP